MKNIKRSKKGFTLIELVVSVAVVGVLAVVAAPKVAGVAGDARTAGIDGMAASLATASSMNYNERKKLSTNGNAVITCTDTPASLAGGTLPGAYVFTLDDGDVEILPGETGLCRISTLSTPVATAEYLAYGIE